ncbi:MAG: DUF5106 domain-containing protein [Bacteroidales bacterium]
MLYNLFYFIFRLKKQISIFILLLCVLSISTLSNAQGRINPALTKIVNLQVPPLISQERSTSASYVVMHFFDPFPFTDRNLLQTSLVEQAIAIYVSALSEVSEKKGQESLQSVLKKASADSVMLHKFIYSLEQIFKSNNEIEFGNAYMETVLDFGIHAPHFSGIEKKRMGETLAKVQKNKVGSLAPNLEFVNIKGENLNLYTLESPYILLIFTNPGCSACGDLRSALQANTKLQEMVSTQQLCIVNVYLGEDLTQWQNYAKEYPLQWLYLRDKNQAVYTKDIYYVPAIPSAYLLDKDKKIILKDAAYPLIEQTLLKL